LEDWKNVKILNFEHNYNKRLIAEIIHINEQKNGINYKKDTEILDGSPKKFYEFNFK